MCKESQLNAMVLCAIVVICLLGAYKTPDPTVLLSNAMAGLLGFIGKGAVDGIFKR